MNIFSLPISVKNGISASPDFLMALAFLVTWIEPTALGNDMLKYFMLIMLLEFITIHSAGFLGVAIITGKTTFQKIIRIIGLGILYSIFIGAFSMQAGDLWPLGAFWLLLLNRIMAVLFSTPSESSFQIVVMVNWAWSVFCYLISIMFSIILPLPWLGWNSEIAKHMGPGWEGLWFDQPHTLLAAGFFYFMLTGFFEMYSHKITAIFANFDPKIPLFKKQ